MEKRRFTDAEIGKLIRLVEMGLDFQQIGDQLGRNAKSVEHKLYRIRQVVHPVKPRPVNVLPPETKEWWQFWK